MIYYAIFFAGVLFGVLTISLLRSGSIADEMALVVEIDRLRKDLAAAQRVTTP